MTGFGRKGLDTMGSAQPDLSGLRNPARGATLTKPAGFGASASDELARKRAAFIASERSRSAQNDEEPGADGASGRGGPAARGIERSLPLAYLLWFVLGAVSAHRFYLGAYQSAVVQVGTLGLGLAVSLSAVGGAGEQQAYLGLGILAIWAIWAVGDVLVIHSIHRKQSRGTGKATTAFA